MSSLFCCPLCGGALERQGGALRCAAGHAYDLAREGYCNLLPVNQKHSAAPGDDRGMAAARRAFLSKDYYRPLLDALCALAVSHTGGAPAVLDAGCGEGYYTAGLERAMRRAGKTPRVAGTDISKVILRAAAKRTPAAEFAVASSYRLPLADRSIDLLVNCFSPLAEEEFRRVVKPGSAFFYVVPAAEHLWELKQVLYDAPYRNEERLTPYDGFAYETVAPVDGWMELPTQQDIRALFQMTPYYWKTPRAGCARCAALSSLRVRFSFRIHVFTRTNDDKI